MVDAMCCRPRPQPRSAPQICQPVWFSRASIDLNILGLTQLFLLPDVDCQQNYHVILKYFKLLHFDLLYQVVQDSMQILLILSSEGYDKMG